MVNMQHFDDKLPLAPPYEGHFDVILMWKCYYHQDMSYLTSFSYQNDFPQVPDDVNWRQVVISWTLKFPNVCN